MDGQLLFIVAGLVFIYQMFDAVLITSPAFKISYITLSVLAIGMFLI